MTARRRELVNVWTIPLLLVVVACLQIGRAAALDQSSFAGFGFGMFATYENRLSRWIDVEVATSDGETTFVAPDPGTAFAALDVPTESNLRRIGAEALAATPEAAQATVTLWTIDVRGRPMTVTPVVHSRLVVEADP